jgi:hypothetical protein
MITVRVIHLQGLLTCLSAFVSFITLFPLRRVNPLQKYQSNTTDAGIIAISGNKCTEPIPRAEFCLKLRMNRPSRTS